jgi:hypothetical protein
MASGVHGGSEWPSPLRVSAARGAGWAIDRLSPGAVSGPINLPCRGRDARRAKPIRCTPAYACAWPAGPMSSPIRFSRESSHRWANLPMARLCEEWEASSWRGRSDKLEFARSMPRGIRQSRLLPGYRLDRWLVRWSASCWASPRPTASVPAGCQARGCSMSAISTSAAGPRAIQRPEVAGKIPRLPVRTSPGDPPPARSRGLQLSIPDLEHEEQAVADETGRGGGQEHPSASHA